MARKMRAKTMVKAMWDFVQYLRSEVGFESASATRLLSTGIGAMMRCVGAGKVP
jgi:hypothetical protein